MPIHSPVYAKHYELRLYESEDQKKYSQSAAVPKWLTVDKTIKAIPDRWRRELEVLGVRAINMFFSIWYIDGASETEDFITGGKFVHTEYDHMLNELASWNEKQQYTHTQALTTTA